MTTFTDLTDDNDILRVLEEMKITSPTGIQQETIPPIMDGRDVIGLAKTGSGKTFAFGIPIIHHLEAKNYVQAMIVTPTRELCQQVADEIRKLGKYKNVIVAEIYGGVSINPQIEKLQKAHIVVGTPGRLLDHIDRGTLVLDETWTLVLDEADRMLDMGFIEDIESIIKAMPYVEQVLLFSATMPPQIKKIAEKYLDDPHHVRTSSHVQREYLPQYYYTVEHNRKFSLLMHLLNGERPQKGLIFCGTRSNADAVARNLRRHRLKAEEIHGGLTQAKRTSVMEGFKKGTVPLLIATDVAARGLDIQDVTHVINYDVPKNPEDYIHRIGRTARAGKKGKAITLLCNQDFPFYQQILDVLDKEPERLTAENVKDIPFRRHETSGPRRGPPRGMQRPQHRGKPFRRR